MFTSQGIVVKCGSSKDLIHLLTRKESLKDPVPACVRLYHSIKIIIIEMLADDTGFDTMTMTIMKTLINGKIQAKTFLFGFAKTSKKAFSMQR